MKSIASFKGLKGIMELYFFSFPFFCQCTQLKANYQYTSWTVVRKEEVKKGRESSFRWNELLRYLLYHVVGNEIYETKKASCL